MPQKYPTVDDIDNLDSLSLRILQEMAKEPTTALTFGYLGKELGVDWKEVRKLVKNMSDNGYVEHSGFGAGCGSREAYNISAHLLQEPFVGKLL